MKLKYKHQHFQAEAAMRVVESFQGQPYVNAAEYVMDTGSQSSLLNTGFGNSPLVVRYDGIAENIRRIQTEQSLQPINNLQGDGINLTIEMETGTGKTYTYIKTMYELNKHYGWTKFIVVVPSIAIREGVLKSFQTMQDHFAQEYGKRIQYFVYNSKNLNQIDNFASDTGLHVMIINTQAFNHSFDKDKKNSDTQIIFSKRDIFGSRRPIDIIAKTHPVMIIDEPQSVLGANAANSTRKNLKEFNPLCNILYSATHREVINMVYRLDAIDAYNMKLVKKIEVKGISQVGSTATNGYVYLEKIIISHGNPQARISYETMSNTGKVRQVTRVVDDHFDIYPNSGNLEGYKNGYVIERIDGVGETVQLQNGIVLTPGDIVGKVNEDYLRRIQIRETIHTHFERERQLYKKGIKVLSLFFIDHVENYRTYGTEGIGNGKFAEIFEEEYNNALKEISTEDCDKDYKNYLNSFKAEQVHQGYFSRDKKGNFIDSKISKTESSSSDESAYDLIMKDKERLLSFEEPVRFIFSHSALKEGWDNPNVFQICTLKNSDNETKKRQEVGRGMRLCVNKFGERQDEEVLGNGVFDTNILTVIASESYDQFAKKLQNEIAEAVDDRPLKVTIALFENVMVTFPDGTKGKITKDTASLIYKKLYKQNYIDDNDQLTPQFFEDKKAGKYHLEGLEKYNAATLRQLEIVVNPHALKVEDARKPKEAVFMEEAFKKKEFQELWKRINVKSYYKVDFESNDLITKAIKAIDEHLNVTQIRIVVERGSMNEIRDKEQLIAGTAMVNENVSTYQATEAVGSNVTYDLIGKLVEATGLTRKTIVAILKGINSEKFKQFNYNPEEFIVKVGNIINDEKAMAVIQQISYQKTTNTYDSDIFTENVVRGKIGINAIQSVKSLYDLVVVDSAGIEKNFAEELEKETDVVVYTKLPRGFYINTPMGHYNPDWAICFQEGKVKHIYFIAETKGNDWQRSQLRGAEEAKIECAARHFKAISQDGKVQYGIVKDYKTLYDKVMQ